MALRVLFIASCVWRIAVATTQAAPTSRPSSSATIRTTQAPSSTQACPINCYRDAMTFESWKWFKYITPVVVGTAVVIIDQANNRTVTSTTYNETATSRFMSNGTLRTLGGRTATASSFVRAGTSNITVQWPTAYRGVETIDVAGTLRYTANGTISCTSWPGNEVQTSQLPSHLPWPAATPAPSVDPSDPYGETYVFISAIPGVQQVYYTDITSAFPGNALIASIYQNCSVPSSKVPGQAFATTVGALISTTTQIMTGSSSSSSTSSTSKTSPIAAALQPGVDSAASSSTISTSTTTTSLNVPAALSPGTTSTTTTPSLAQVNAPTTPTAPSPSVQTSVNAAQSGKDSPAAQTPTSATTTCTGAACLILAGISGQATTSAVPQAVASSTATVFQLGSTTVTKGSSSQVVVGSQTLVPGGSPITQGGTTLSLASNGGSVIVNGQSTVAAVLTTLVPPPSSTGIFVIASSTITPGPASQVVVGSQTLLPGSTIVQSGTTLALASDGGAIIANGRSTISIVAPTSSNVKPLTLTAISQTQVVLGSQTLTLTGQTISISGTDYSVAGAGTVKTLVPITSASTGTTGTQHSSAKPFTITANSQTQAVIGSQTITLTGQTASISGTIYSVAGSGTIKTLVPITSALTQTTGTQHGIIITANGQTQAVIGSQTLTLTGQSVTISGTVYSIEGSGTLKTLLPKNSILSQTTGMSQTTGAQYRGTASASCKMSYLLAGVSSIIILASYL